MSNKQFPIPFSFTPGGGGGSGTVTSVTFTGDGTVLSSTPSAAVTTSGTLPATLANASANTVLGNATGAPTTPTYTSAPVVTSLTCTDTAANADLIEQNTTVATVATTNASPTHQFKANYWTGAASATDTWTVGSSLAAGANGASTLTLSQSGSSGAAQVLFPTGSGTSPSVAVRSTQGISSTSSSNLQIIAGGSSSGITLGTTSSQFGLNITAANAPVLSPSANGNSITLAGSVASQNSAGVVLSGTASYTSTSSAQAGVDMLGTFAPTSGTAPFFGLLVSNVINQTGGANGPVRCLAAYPQNTAVGGTEYLLALGTTSAAGINGTLTDKFLVDSTGSILKYNGEATASPGIPYTRGLTSQKSETNADSSLLSVTPASAAGTYRLQVVLSVSAASSATIGWTATWTDSNGNAQSPTNLSLFQSGAAAPALTFTTSTAGNYYGEAIVDINNTGTAIVIKTTFSGTSIAYKATATIERLA